MDAKDWIAASRQHTCSGEKLGEPKKQRSVVIRTCLMPFNRAFDDCHPDFSCLH
jgi:hypothetical protein